MVYTSTARCRHRHPTTLASFTVRQYKSGIAAATMYAKHPELGHFLGVHIAVETSEFRSLKLRIMERIAVLLERVSWFRPHGWYRTLMENHYHRGLSAELLRRRLMDAG